MLYCIILCYIILQYTISYLNSICIICMYKSVNIQHAYRLEARSGLLHHQLEDGAHDFWKWLHLIRQGKDVLDGSGTRFCLGRARPTGTVLCQNSSEESYPLCRELLVVRKVCEVQDPSSADPCKAFYFM